MGVRAVVFDVGGVLEVVGPPGWTGVWSVRLGLTQEEFDSAVAEVDPDGLAETGGIAEGDLRAGYRRVLGLTAVQAEEFMADVWDWYCGRLDEELVAYARGLRPRVRTGILSNSADGARREEHRRYRLPELVDVVVYSHEVGLAKPDPRVYALTCERLGVKPGEVVFVDDLAVNVDAATAAGLLAVRHQRTADTIAEVDRLLRIAG